MNERGKVNDKKLANLVLNSERTPKERKEIAKKGGKASAKARAERKKFKELIDIALSKPADKDTLTVLGAKSGMKYDEAIIFAQVIKAARGDTTAFKELRDTVGEKPVDKIEAEIKSNEAQAELKEYMELLKKGG